MARFVVDAGTSIPAKSGLQMTDLANVEWGTVQSAKTNTLYGMLRKR